MKMIVFPLAASFVMASLAPALAEDRAREISVTGHAEVSAAPDLAMVQIGVTHQAQDAGAAMAETASRANAVMAQLSAMGIEPRDIQTSQVSLTPVWSNRSSGAQTRDITGFVARISVSLRVRDLDQLGPVLDAVISDGANQLGGIRFGFDDPDGLLAQARAEAVADGRLKAEQLAGAAGVPLGQLVTLSEFSGGGGVQPMAMEMAAARDASIPIAAGELSLSASVSMIYRIGD